MKVDDLKAYKKNPRKITGEDFALLGESLEEFGDLSGIILNRTSGEVVGGNQRSTFFKQDRKNCEIVLTEEFKKPTNTGTVALGYIVYKDEKYGFRMVEWDAQKEERANILANKVGGQWDFDILANQFDSEILLQSGWKEFELGFGKPSDDNLNEREKDTDLLNDTMDSYLHGNIRQVTFHFSVEEFEVLMPKLDRIMAEEGLNSHTDVFLKLIQDRENTRSTEEKA